MSAHRIDETIASFAEQVIEGKALSDDQAHWLASLSNEHLHDLFRAASRIRDHFVGRGVRCCSIVAAKTGRCREDCAFCSQSQHHGTRVEGLTVLDEDQVFQAAMEAAVNGAQSFGIVNSGYGPTDQEVEHWSRVVQRIRDTGKILVCASLGVLTPEQAERLKQAGVHRYNHNLQTSRRHFPGIVKTHTYDERLATLQRLQETGIRVCSGVLFGMGETWADRIELALELRRVNPDVVPINFLIPIEGTPLEGMEPLEPMECLRIIAIYRFLLAQQSLKIAGGREVNLRDLQSWIFYAGADSFLVGNYLTTCGRSADDDHRMIRDLGLEMQSRPVSDDNVMPPPGPVLLNSQRKSPLPHAT